MGEIPHVSLGLSNRAENVLLVRQTLNGIAETVGLDAVELNDISTAVTEACNNVVLHAYAGARGPLEVDVFAGTERVRVLVRDHGGGIAPEESDAGERDPEEIVGGIGLPVIRALSDSVEFRALDGGGTEVRMEFIPGPARPLPRLERALDADGQANGADPHEATAWVSVGPARLSRAVLPRLICALAARANFSTDRISDSQLLADALVAHAEDAVCGARLDVEIAVAPRELRLRLGPLRAGGAEQVLADATVDSVGSVFERLADEPGIAVAGAAETLALRLTAARP